VISGSGWVKEGRVPMSRIDEAVAPHPASQI